MPFFMVDDDSPANRKMKALTEPVLLAGDITGVAALGLWTLAGAVAQKAGRDGMVNVADLVGILLDRTIAVQLADRLVDAGLWHAAGHTCRRCEPVPEQHWRFHDWWDLRYKRAEDMREAWAKSKENKRPEIVNAVWVRDCLDPSEPLTRLRAECRYCGKLVKRADRTSDDAPTLDHVDPRYAKGPRNLVVACGPCNRTKAGRTPAEAGMTLRPAPRALTAEAEALGYDDTLPTPPTRDPAAVAVPPGTTPDAGTPRQDPQDAAQGPRSTTAPPSPPPGPTAAVAAPERALVGGAADSSSPAPPSAPHSSESPLAGARVGGRAGAPGSGSGTGSVSRSGTGSGVGSPAPPAPRSRKRKRGRGGRPPRPQSNPPGPADLLDAGSAPLVYPPPSGASPWKEWRGPRSPISDENRCTVHPAQHVPCPKCSTPRET